jgi:DNA polymerase-3 subunit gamma/tau
MTIERMETSTQARIETYIPLYRKYRPQLFADLVGQEAISQTLGNAIQLNKVAHAYLFCGPRGTGKTSTARIFAKSLNCEHGPTVSPCLQCASCTGIAQGNALDVIEFDAASNNGVGDARELIENCQYSSMSGRFKVYIIDEVHMLTSQAFNALLKTLEEPPANVIFIFATTEAHKVLPTIISRCQRFDFNRITTDNIVERLRYIAKQESIAIDEEALLMIGRHARGGLRDAVGLLDQVSVLSRAQADKVISRQDVALFIGTLEEDLLLRLSGAIAERRAADLLNELNALLNRGIEPIQLLKDLTFHFRNLLLVQAAGGNTNPELLSLPPDYFKQLFEQSALFPEMEEIPQIIARLSFVERNVRSSSQPQLWLEVGLIELAYRHEIQLVKDLSDRVARLESQLAVGGASATPLAQPKPMPAKQTATKPQPVAPVAQAEPYQPSMVVSPPPKPSPVAPKPPAAKPSASAPTEPISKVMQAMPLPVLMPAQSDVTSLEAIYNQACDSMPPGNYRTLVKQHTRPVSLEGDLLVIGCTNDLYLTKIKDSEKMTHLQRAVNKAFGPSLKFEIIVAKKPTGHGEEPPVAIPPKPKASAPVMASTPAPVEAIASPPSAMALEKSSAASVVGPAMPELNELQPVNPMTESPALAVNLPPAVDEMPPMEMGSESSPSFDEEDLDASASEALFLAPVSVSGLAGDPEWGEAKKHAVELLQGRILE